MRSWNMEIQGARHQFASLVTAAPIQLPWFPRRSLGTEQHEVHMPAQQSPKNSVDAPKLPQPTLPVCPYTSLFYRSDVGFTSSCKYFHRLNK